MNEQYRQYLLEGERAGERYRLGAPRTMQRGLVGSWLGNRSGSSLEFMDHRQYMPGDDIRRIDWNAFARTDKLSIKLFRDEVSPHVDIIIDCSRSMALLESQKARATLGLAAVLAQAALNSDYTFTAWQVRRACERIPAGTERPSAWDDIDFDSEISCSESFRLQMPAFRPRGIRMLLSDLLWLNNPIETLSILAEKASAVFVIQLLAEADINPAGRGNIRLRDSETNQIREIFIDAVAEKKYKENLTRHQTNWNRGCKQVGALMASLVAESIVEHWDLEELVHADILQVI